MRFLITAAILLSMLTVPLSPHAPAKSSVADGAEARLVFVGDLMFGRYVRASLLAHGFDAPFANVTAWLSSADLTVGNLEGPLVPANKFAMPNPSPSSLNLTGDARSIPALARAGFDLVSLANNHSYDAGPAGLRATVTGLWEADVAPFGLDMGSQQRVVREAHGLNIAFLGYTTIVNMPTKGIGYVNPTVAADRERLAKEVRQARTGVDLLVVMMHWGNEYEARPNSWQRLLAQVASEAGADLIVGAHPHVLFRGWNSFPTPGVLPSWHTRWAMRFSTSKDGWRLGRGWPWSASLTGRG